MQFPDVYSIYDNPFEPQPGKHITSHDQRVHIGRLKIGGEKNVVGMIAMGHNLVRGAAGAALLNMEATLNRMGEIT